MKLLLSLLLVVILMPSCISVKMDGINPNAVNQTYEDENSSANNDLREVFETSNIKKIDSPFFIGEYIIKPLWAFSSVKVSDEKTEEGENELFIKIIVDGVEKRTFFQQDKNLVKFSGNNFEFILKKDSVITIELWDKDLLSSDLLIKRVGVIPADLDQNDIFSLVDKNSRLDILFIAKPKADDDYKVFNKSIKITEGENKKVDMNFPLIFNHKAYKLANKAIDELIPYLDLYNYRIDSVNASSIVSNTYRVVYKSEKMFSIVVGEFVNTSKCMGSDCPSKTYALTFLLDKGKVLEAKGLFYENAYNSNAVCKIINKKEKSEILNCNSDKNININFNNFALNKEGVEFIIEYDNAGVKSSKSAFINFDELKGIVNTDNF